MMDYDPPGGGWLLLAIAAITAALVALKLAGMIGLAWWLVLAPAWVPLFALVVIGVVVLAGAWGLE